MEFLALSPLRLVILVGLGLSLLAALLVLRALLKLTKVCLGLGLLGILVVLVAGYFILRALAG